MRRGRSGGLARRLADALVDGRCADAERLDEAAVVQVCPFNLFEVRRMEDADFAGLVFAKLAGEHRQWQEDAYTPSVPAWEACGKCVEACPQKAIEPARVAG